MTASDAKDGGASTTRTNLAVQLSRRLICMLIDDMNTDEMRQLVNAKFITPMLNAMFAHTHPYLLVAFSVMLVNMAFSLLACILCTLSYLRK